MSNGLCLTQQQQQWKPENFGNIASMWLKKTKSSMGREPMSDHLNDMIWKGHQQRFHSKEWSIASFSCSLTGDSTSHSIQNVGFIAYSDVRWLYYQYSHYVSYTLLFRKVGRMCFLGQRSKHCMCFWACIFHIEGVVSKLVLHGIANMKQYQNVKALTWFTSTTTATCNVWKSCYNLDISLDPQVTG